MWSFTYYLAYVLTLFCQPADALQAEVAGRASTLRAFGDARQELFVELIGALLQLLGWVALCQVLEGGAHIGDNQAGSGEGHLPDDTLALHQHSIFERGLVIEPPASDSCDHPHR
jgi:hypothetical protein